MMLMLLGLTLFGWAVFDLVHDVGVQSRRREIITLCSLVISLALYSVSAVGLLDLSDEDLAMNIFYFRCCSGTGCHGMGWVQACC